MKFFDPRVPEEDFEILSSRVREVLESGQYIGGEKVAQFENQMEEYFGLPFVSCNSGTDAIILALKALAIGPGDEVIVPGFTYFATIEPIYHVGATPVLADISKTTYNIDPHDIEERITSKTKAIMPVHLFGLACDMTTIMAIAKKHNLFVIEDAAQAFGATHAGKKVGSFGDVNCFSFFPTKNVGGFGDGGGITVKDKQIEERLRMLKNHGQKVKYTSDIMGYNSRLDPIQAVLLLYRFEKLEEYLEIRRDNAKKWQDEFKGREDILNLPMEEEHSYNNFSILVSDRKKFTKELEEREVPYVIYYEKAVYDQKAYIDSYGESKPLLNIEYVKNHILSIPVYY